MNRQTRLLASGLALGWSLLASASAATLTVRVVDASGQPVPDVAVVVRSPGLAPRVAAMAPVEITQQGMRFVPAVSVVTPGTKVRFTNRDSFDHHVKGSQAQVFEYRIAGSDAGSTKPSSSPEVVIEGGPGPVTLGCLLHSRMQGSLYVTDSPWHGISGADGSVQLANVPDGALQVVVWHPQQFIEQPAVPVQVAGATRLSVSLNFTPRARR
ncbi:plastocyanin [Ideonella margarita]|uniref:Plastocyanin n=1 Tax=Ideonella margarita TaxID=2984191 RepID=A0ABU9C4E3_9BURK